MLSQENMTNDRSRMHDLMVVLFSNAVLSGYITTLKNKQKLNVSSEGKLTLDEGPSLETSSFSLFFKVVI
jgi:hypothetical protein